MTIDGEGAWKHWPRQGFPCYHWVALGRRPEGESVDRLQGASQSLNPELQQDGGILSSEGPPVRIGNASTICCGSQRGFRSAVCQVQSLCRVGLGACFCSPAWPQREPCSVDPGR